MKFFYTCLSCNILYESKDVSPEFDEKGGYNVVNSNAV